MGDGWGVRRPVLAVGLLFASAFPGCEQLVVNEVPLVEVRITPDPVSLLEGDRQTLEARPLGPDGETLPERSVIWTASPSGVVSVDPDGALFGVAPGTAEVTARIGGVESSVEVTVLQGPTLRLSPSELQFSLPVGSAISVERAVQVENEGNGSLSSLTRSVELEDGADASWLTATLGSSSAPTTLVVRAEVTGLEVGTYRGKVVVADPAARNGPREVEVELDVALGPPVIRVDPNSLQFSARSGTQAVATEELSVQHIGGAQVDDLDVSVRYASLPNGWLTATLSGPEPPAVLTLEASAESFSVGEFEADVEVFSKAFESARAIVHVTFQVN